MAEPTRMAIIGCGAAGRRHAASVRDSDKVQVVACADLELGRAEACADKFGIPAHGTDAARMLAEHQPELVALCTWPGQRQDDLQLVAEGAPRALVCETPFAHDGPTGDRYQALLLKHGVFCMQGDSFRHHPQLQMAKAMTAKIGRVRLLRGQFCFMVAPDSGNWRLDPARGGGALLEQGSCLLSALGFFAGAPVAEVTARSVTGPSGVDTTTSGELLYENGVIAQITCSIEANWRQQVEIHGDRGTIVVPQAFLTAGQERYLEIQEETPGERQVQRFDFPSTDANRMQLENFHSLLTTNMLPQVPLDETILSLYALGALRRAAESGAREPVVIDPRRKAELTRVKH